MSAQAKPIETSTEDAAVQPTAGKPADAKPTHRAISDPREVATVVMSRMNMVNVKKDELASAINGLVDITQQLTRTYAAQLLAIEQLRRRVKALEAGGGAGVEAPAQVQ